MEFYHDYSALGLQLPQRGGIYPPNQKAKAPILTGYLLFAMGKVRARGNPVTIAELFCADAYYSFVARRFGADRCDAFDNNRDGHLAEARHVQAELKDDGVVLHETDVFDIPGSFTAAIVINAGGLYHVSDPLMALDRSYAMARDYLIVQSVVSIATDDDRYFETPCPGWTWGCRFTYEFLQREIAARGWRVVDTERNILTGNDRPEDRGSVYFLIDKDHHS